MGNGSFGDMKTIIHALKFIGFIITICMSSVIFALLVCFPITGAAIIFDFLDPRMTILWVIYCLLYIPYLYFLGKIIDL